MKPTLILVAGAARSGTTLLDAMLGSNDRSFSCGEPFAWFRPFAPRHKLLNCTCGADRCSVWEKIAPGPEESFHARVFDRLGVDVVVDSSKDLSWMSDSLERARAADLQTRVVVIWKDPLELAHSWRKRGHLASRFRKGDSGRKIRRQLRSHLDYHRQVFALASDFVAVPYRTLADSPEPTLQALAEALMVPYCPGQAEFWKEPVHLLFGSGSIRRVLESPEPRIERPPESPQLESDNHRMERIANREAALGDLQAELQRRSVV